MAIQNLNLVLNTVCQANTAKQGRDAVAGVLGLRMPPTPSQGRPTSPGSATFEPSPMARPSYRAAKRGGRSVAVLPGNPVRPHGWRESVTWATSIRSGLTAIPGTVTGRGLFAWCERHPITSGHDYPSHDRRDARQQTRSELASTTNRGK
jgi:hypothetical protein